VSTLIVQPIGCPGETSGESTCSSHVATGFDGGAGGPGSSCFAVGVSCGAGAAGGIGLSPDADGTRCGRDEGFVSSPSPLASAPPHATNMAAARNPHLVFVPMPLTS